MVTATFLFLACGSKVDTVRPNNKDLTKYQTFAFLPNANVDVEGQNYGEETVNQAIVETLNSSMRNAGYTLDRDNPDLLVLLSLSTDKGLQRAREPIYSIYPYTAAPYGAAAPWYGSYSYRGWQNFGGVVGYTTDTYPYEEGTLVIDIIDRESQESVWKGIISEDIYGQGNTQAVTGMINDVFKEYPLNNS